MTLNQKLVAVSFSAAASFVALPAAAAVNLIENGSFEDGGISTSYQIVYAGETLIPHWTVETESVDIIKDYWPAQDGLQSIDNFGIGRGVLTQSFTTEIGKQYAVSFSYSANPGYIPPQLLGQRVLLVDVTGTGNLYSGSFQYTETGNSLSDMKWASGSFSFVADSTSTKIGFGGTVAGGVCSDPALTSACNSFGPALDNVMVTAIPEPGEWAMMVAGLGVVGLLARRRRKA